jgi:hypothetical protein
MYLPLARKLACVAGIVDVVVDYTEDLKLIIYSGILACL